MAKFHRSLLSTAVIMATVTAAPVVLAASEPELTLSTRTFYFNRDFHEGPEDRVAAAQAFRADYLSPTFGERFQFGLTALANIKLDGRNNDAAADVNRANSDGETEHSAKIGQVFFDAGITTGTKVRIGRVFMNLPLLNNPDIRSTPGSHQVVMLDGKWENSRFYAVYNDEAVTRSDISFEEYTSNGEDYEVLVAGGAYKFENGLGVHASYGYADDYQRQIYLNTNYTFDLGDARSLLIDFYHYDGEAEGNLYPDPDYNSTMTNLAARYTFGNVKLLLSYQTIGGDDAYDFAWGGSDQTLHQTWQSIQFNDFNRDDEDSWQIRADYSFEGVPGLSGWIRHAEGTYDEGVAEVDEAESNLDLSYTIQTGKLREMTFRLRYAHIEADAYSDIDEVRFMMNYTF
ncbi:OprD family outer membrane porin [Pontibacterium granulatum]|uniref:OprD family outer membrane porin n=1 Tax=Pontibacterium granulatum TaxID=2036029 RepID=UPI00249A292A|nr:OprD family outer membrane porin [Pontibacterium granulatum]MDI3323997.1 OprD family outer membrane porin [Pontibacterium granulatum]